MCVGCVASVVGRWGAVVVSVLAGEVVDVGGGVGKKVSVCVRVCCATDIVDVEFLLRAAPACPWIVWWNVCTCEVSVVCVQRLTRRGRYRRKEHW